MAPDYATKLVVWTLDFKGGILQGPAEYYESKTDTLLGIRWDVTACPPGYRQVGNGLAYVRGLEDWDPEPGHEEQRPTPLPDSRYRWDEGFRPFDLSLNLMLLLPEGYTARRIQPPPTKVKEFGNRLALCWILPRADLQEAGKTVEWNLVPLQDSPAAEAQRINQFEALGYASSDAMVVVEDLPYEPSTIRDLLIAGFSVPDLLGLLKYSSNPQLRSLRNQFGLKDSLSEVVDSTIEYCDKQLLLSDLLREVERANPRQFEWFRPKLVSR